MQRGLVAARILYPLRTADQHVRADELSEAEGLQVLPAPLRPMMDTLRMIACLPR